MKSNTAKGERTVTDVLLKRFEEKANGGKPWKKLQNGGKTVLNKVSDSADKMKNSADKTSDSADKMKNSADKMFDSSDKS